MVLLRVVVSSLASLASISVAVSLIISVSVSISLGTLATLAAVVIWFRLGLRFRLWFGMNRLRPVRVMVWLDDVMLLIRFIPAAILMVVWVIDFVVCGIIDFMIWVNRVERLVAPLSWFLRFRFRFWFRFVTSITRLASLASITTAIVTSLATLAAIAVAVSIIISVSVSISLGTLSTLAIWFRFGVVWLRLRMNRLRLMPLVTLRILETRGMVYNVRKEE